MFLAAASTLPCNSDRSRLCGCSRNCVSGRVWAVYQINWLQYLGCYNLSRLRSEGEGIYQVTPNQEISGLRGAIQSASSIDFTALPNAKGVTARYIAVAQASPSFLQTYLLTSGEPHVMPDLWLPWGNGGDIGMAQAADPNAFVYCTTACSDLGDQYCGCAAGVSSCPIGQTFVSVYKLDSIGDQIGEYFYSLSRLCYFRRF